MNNTLRLRSILAFGVSAVALIGAAPAFAAAAAAPAAPAASDEGLNQVIVTAEKREVSLEKVPVAVSVFTSKQRDVQGIENLQDMTNFTPGLVYSSVLDRVALRGIGRLSNNLAAEAGVATYVDGFFTTSAVEASKPPMFIDRIEVERGPQGTLFGRNAIGGAINVITKHPTDDFYAEGRVTVGNYGYVDLEGAISGPVAKGLDLRLSGFETRQTQGYYNNVVPGMPSEGNVLNEYYIEPQFDAKGDSWDWFVKAFAAGWDNRGGPGARGSYTTGRYDFNEFTTTPGLFFNAAYGYTAAGQGPFFSLSGLPAFNLVEAGTATNNPALTNVHNFNTNTPLSVKLKNSYDIDTTFTWHAPTFDVKYTGGYQTYNYNLLFDTDGTSITSFQIPLTTVAGHPASACGLGFLGPCGPLTVFPTIVTSYQEFNHWYSHELTFASTTSGPLQWIGGFYYYDENYSNPVSVNAPNQPQVAAPSGGPANPNHYLFFSNYAMETRSEAAYGQLDWKVTDQIKLTGGLRYTTDHKEGTEWTRLVLFESLPTTLTAAGPLTAENFGSSLPAVDITPLTGGNTAVGLAKGATSYTIKLSNGLATRTLGGNSDAVTGTAGVEWTPTDQTLAYFRYSRGYKAFALNAGPIASSPEAAPEFDNDYEVGLKQTFGRKFTLNAAFYYNDYENAQIPIGVNVGGAIVSEFFNVPKARSDGIELEGNWAPIDHLQLSADYSLNDTAILSTCSLVGGVPTGTCLVNAADPAGSLPGARPVGTLGAQNVSGNPLPQAPRNKFGFNANYTFVFTPGSLILSGSYIWRDVQYADIFKNTVSSSPSWDQVDLRLTWRSTDDRYEIVGYMRNVLNKAGYEAAATGTQLSYGVVSTYGLNPPRTFGVELHIKTP
jgi:iron complex outermembrane receptor protein